MKYLALLAVLVPAIALAQDSETNCYTYGAGSTQCRTTERRTPQVVAPDIAGAFEQDTAEIGKRIAEIAHQMLGYDPSVEAFQLAVRQLQSSQKEE